MKYFSKKSFTMRQVIGLLTIVFLGITVFTFAAVSFTDFTERTTISSVEMNTKLNALKDGVNKITAFSHMAAVDNIYGAGNHVTTINNPATNNDPNAILVVINNWRGVYNDHNVGVWYDPPTNRWTIYNEDYASMPLGATFNVVVIKP